MGFEIERVLVASLSLIFFWLSTNIMERDEQKFMGFFFSLHNRLLILGNLIFGLDYYLHICFILPGIYSEN